MSDPLVEAFDAPNVPRRGYGTMADCSLRLHDLRRKSSSWRAHLIIAVTKPLTAILLLIRGNPS